ncbi:hypothetical protein Y032_0004g1704 [Ancylostoma ceylanicum]|uniref:Uncharacterized protein n=1 Tax=Ancylostoma ceylanicum TaxID=53326 RepID=A0A016VTM3_9BILA|nr:hypothetical protein Y032_0004g1704 [Ancylostoma ceylanicum]
MAVRRTFSPTLPGALYIKFRVIFLQEDEVRAIQICPYATGTTFHLSGSMVAPTTWKPGKQEAIIWRRSFPTLC